MTNLSLCDKNPLSAYGKYVAEYQGTGIFISTDRQTYGCKFVAGQMVDGTTLLLCDITLQKGQSLSSENLFDITFKGETEEGWKIWTEKSISPINNLSNWGSSIRYSFLLSNLFIQVSDLSDAKIANFKVTNFEFSGSTEHNTYLELTLPELNTIQILKVENYDEIMTRIQTLKKIDITCEIITEVTCATSLSVYEKLLNEFCLIMSVARGTKTHWVFYDIRNNQDSLVFRAHYSTITRPYSPLHAIIDRSIFGVNETKYFLEHAFTTVINKSQLRESLPVLVNSYVNAKKTDYWEMKGLNVVVVFEMLKNYAINNPDMRINEYILSNEVFEKLEESLKSTVSKSDLSAQQRGQIYQNLNGVNRTSFGYILSQFCEQIHLEIETEDYRSLMASRNKLVHEGRFYFDCATPEERERFNPYSSRAEEYFFLVNFLDKVFLRLFDYRGLYINCRFPENITRKDRI